MNKWLYRAAGTVGIAGGVLMLGAGSAHADQTDSLGSPLPDVFSPTSGLPPVDLIDGDWESPGTGGLRLDPADGRRGLATGLPAAGVPELLPGLPTGGLDALLGRLPLGGLPVPVSLPLDSLPLDSLPVNGLPVNGLPVNGLPVNGLPVPAGTRSMNRLPVSTDALPVAGLPVPVDGLPVVGGPADRTDPAVGVGLPAGRLVSMDGQLAGLPTAPQPGTLVALGGAGEAGPAGASAGQPELAGIGEPEIVGPLPFLTGPLTNSLLGGRSLGDLARLGDLAGQVPVAGPMISQTLGSLPLVGDVAPGIPWVDPAGREPAGAAPGARTLPAGLDAPGLPLPLPVGAERLPAMIADQLAAERGLPPELLGTPAGGAPTAAGAGPAEFIGAVPLLGPALDPISRMVGVGNLANQLPLVGPLAGSALGSLPVISDPAGPAGAPAGPAPLARDPATPGGDRPVAGEDPEFAGPAESARSAEFLPVDPVGMLTRQLPVPLPLEALRSLPLVGGLASGLSL